MIKKILISSFLLLSLATFAQQGSASPYSFYGIGEVRFKGTVENRAMAGIGLEKDSIHINLENPASYAGLKLTTFTIGGTQSSNTLKNSTTSESANRTTIDYLAVGLPLGKFGLGFGLIPYSSVGYRIRSASSEIEGVNTEYSGSGGLNKAFIGLGYTVAKGLSIGADINYNFGRIEATSIAAINDVPYGTTELNRADLSGVNFNFGAMYEHKIGKKLNAYGSLYYSLENSLTSTNIRSVSTFFDISSIDTFELQESSKKLSYPSKITMSAGVGEARKWLVGAKLAYQENPGEANEYNSAANVGYGRYATASVGGYYIPNYNSFTSYFKRIVYRGGIRFEKTGLVVNSESIDDKAITLGMGLPLPGTYSNLNLGLEIGQRGSTKGGLVQQDYINISVGFSFNDKWFQKRKYD